MLFMVIEHFKDVAAIGERFQRKGRMLPDGVVFHASWVEPGGARCFQVMEADSAGRSALDRRLGGPRRLRGHPRALLGGFLGRAQQAPDIEAT